MSDSEYLDRIRCLNVYRRGDRRAPHKPLLLLVAISRLLEGQRDLPYSEVEPILGRLLSAYAPQVVGQHQPELPYWHLRSDELWEIVPGAESFPRQAGGFPKMASLRSSTGHLPPNFADALLSSPELVQEVVSTLLDGHFPESRHEDILADVGLELPDRPPETPGSRRRDPRFRENVIRAYEHRCAVTGFRAALGGLFVGCEAVHIQWHCHEGPDTVDNGLAVEPTLHKLFDAGVWSLTDDRRVLVSADFTGTDATVERIRGLHGETIRSPLPGESPVSVEYIRWHRESDLGGVFHRPALPL